jgi:hypothetical protein
LAPKLSERVQGHIRELFPAESRADVTAALTDECGDNLPLMDDPRLVERIRIAALKLSAGDVTKLLEAVELAQDDWRDLLVTAGFADDPNAHEAWEPGGDG